MKILHICCNLAGSTVFPQMFESLNKAALEQIVFVPERRAKDMHKNEPKGIPTIYRMTVKATDMLFFFRKAQSLRRAHHAEHIAVRSDYSDFPVTDISVQLMLFFNGSTPHAKYNKGSLETQATRNNLCNRLNRRLNHPKIIEPRRYEYRAARRFASA